MISYLVLRIQIKMRGFLFALLDLICACFRLEILDKAIIITKHRIRVAPPPTHINHDVNVLTQTVLRMRFGFGVFVLISFIFFLFIRHSMCSVCVFCFFRNCQFLRPMRCSNVDLVETPTSKQHQQLHKIGMKYILKAVNATVEKCAVAALYSASHHQFYVCISLSV